MFKMCHKLQNKAEAEFSASFCSGSEPETLDPDAQQLKQVERDSRRLAIAG